MKIYHYHPETKEFLFETGARQSPLEPGVFLIPANATNQPAPEAGENEVAVYADGAWTVQPDFRGVWYKGRERIEVDELGPLPEGFTAEPEPFTPSEIKGHQEQEIRARYAALLVSTTQPYGAAERETWKTQEEEAEQWVTDNSAPCTMIRGMAAARGITIDLMVAKIRKNAALFRAASGQILGAQQTELDVLYPDKKEEV